MREVNCSVIVRAMQQSARSSRDPASELHLRYQHRPCRVRWRAAAVRHVRFLVMRPGNANRPQVVGLLGLGMDSDGGYRRITRSETALLLGGSVETHERMQETAIRFEEALERRGKTL